MPVVTGFDESLKKKYTCKKCGAINEIYPNEETKLSEGRDYGGGYDVRFGFRCGNCGSEITTRHY